VVPAAAVGTRPGGVLIPHPRLHGKKSETPGEPDAPMTQPAVPVAPEATGTTKLDELELQIDECLVLAKRVDREGLESVINHLRRARNEAVWKIGQ
jgi:hypothetical protein